VKRQICALIEIGCRDIGAKTESGQRAIEAEKPQLNESHGFS